MKRVLGYKIFGVVLAFVLIELVFNSKELVWHGSTQSKANGMHGARNSGNNDDFFDVNETLPSPPPTSSGKLDSNVGLFCSKILSEGLGISSSRVWNRLSSEIKSASYFPPSMARHERFRVYVDSLFDFYTTNRLKRSLSLPANAKSVKRLVTILENYPKTHIPLRILVVGGSVTQGVSSWLHSVEGLPGFGRTFESSWPSRLEHAINSLLFGGESAVEIINFSIGGSSSEAGVLVLKYQLFPNASTSPPDIVIWSHAANDAHEANLEDVLYRHMQDFVQASHELRPCDEDLPMVIMVDDFYDTENLNVVALQTSRIYAIASWYDLMAVNYANVGRKSVLGTYNNTVQNPLMGNKWSVHFGLGMHIGMTWTVLFNLIDAFVIACSQDQDDITGMANSTLRSGSEKHDQSFSEITNGGTKPLSEMPAKYTGRLTQKISPQQLSDEWKRNVAVATKKCSSGSVTLEKCAYALMANRLTGVTYPGQFEEKLKPILKFTDGWTARGGPFAHEKTGYYAEKEKASFALRLDNVTLDTRFLTILSMKSYGPNFENTELELTASIFHTNGMLNPSFQSYKIHGHHSVKTSINVPHILELPSGGARIGDSIEVNATLMRGAYFKIAGIAFCAV